MVRNYCPSCNSTKILIRDKGPSFTEIIATKKFIQAAYSICYCTNCGLYYKDEVLSSEELNSYYNNFDSNIWTPVEPYPTEEFIYKVLKSSENLNLRILDFGCSDGRFLAKVIGKFDCYGYEIDERAITEARKRGIKMLNFEEMVSLENKFDFIIFSDVFEHLHDPTKVCLQLFGLLNNGGSFIISTGYADAKSCQVNLADYWYFKTVQHLCMIGDRYIEYFRDLVSGKIVQKTICSHYNGKTINKISKKLMFSLRYFFYANVSQKKNSLQFNVFKQIPFLNKVTKWYTQPFYPYFKDHVVVVFKK